MSPRDRTNTGETAPFGFRDVNARQKQGLVDRVFTSVADNYDLMNDLLSGGLHRLWKSELVNDLSLPSTRPAHVLDIAGGTADVALRIARRSSEARITVLDINPAMLAVGRRRAERGGLDRRIGFVEGNAEALDYPDRIFDAASFAFGIRNVTDIEAALSEAYRVLRPSAKLAVLEFSHVDVAVLDTLYDFYSFNIVPRLGEFVVGDGEAYRYLVESIRRFPSQDRFADMMRVAGFRRVAYRNLSGGIAAIHTGWRL